MNRLLKEIRAAASAGRPTDEGLVVAEGPHLLREALRGHWLIQSVVTTETALLRHKTLVERAQAQVVIVPGKTFNQIAGTRTAQEILCLVRPRVWSADQLWSQPGFLIACDAIQDPGNAGTITRSAEAFGASGLILLRGSVRIANGKFMRSSAGSIFRLPFWEDLPVSDFLEQVSRHAFKLYSLHGPASRNITQAHFGGNCVVVVGNEGSGVSPEVLSASDPISIPTRNVESLNAKHCLLHSALRSVCTSRPTVSLFDASPLPDVSAEQQKSSGDSSDWNPDRPLADRMRPLTLDEYVGQDHILQPGKPLRSQVDNERLSSFLLWGPPGSGKTTLARLIARRSGADFIPFSAVMSGIKEIKAVMTDAERSRRNGRRTVLFIDEIHRFNKAQQDAFLPFVEHGDVVLIGATTENPSFEVVSALLSRMRVYPLYALTADQIISVLERAIQLPVRGLGHLQLTITGQLLSKIAVASDGDARFALNALELASEMARNGEIEEEAVHNALGRRVLLYDKSGEEHFNLISALHKSVRSSDPDAALYWLARMMKSGEDRLYLARRLARMAIEDIGLADPRAIEQAMACMQTVNFLGIPEGDQALAQLTLYLSVAPKSDAAYQALNQVMTVLETEKAEPVPLHLRNAPTRLMKQMGYSAGYSHAHREPDAITGMACLPPGLEGRRFYYPTMRGSEQNVSEILENLRNRRNETRKQVD